MDRPYRAHCHGLPPGATTGPMASPSGRGSLRMNPPPAPAPRPPGRWPAAVAIAGNVAIAAGAFYLSFASLTHLATLAGLSPERAWVWPLLVDGMIVVATVAVTTLRGRRSAYAWTLLAGGAAVSILANIVHAALTAPAGVPVSVAMLVAATPPLVLVASTHLTVQLLRASARPATAASPPPEATPPTRTTARARTRAVLPGAGSRERALTLRASGRSNRAIARELSVHPSTVGRWFTAPALAALAAHPEPGGDPDE